MAQRRDGARLTFETQLGFRVVGEMSGQNLDRNRAIEASVSRSIDFAHATRTKRGENLVRPEFGARGEAHPRALYIPERVVADCNPSESLGLVRTIDVTDGRIHRRDGSSAAILVANWTGLVFSPTLSASKVGFEYRNGRSS